jgi:hypothetical protein
MRSFIICTLGLPTVISKIESRRTIWAVHLALMREKRNAYKILVRKPEGKRPHG